MGINRTFTCDFSVNYAHEVNGYYSNVGCEVKEIYLPFFSPQNENHLLALMLLQNV